MWSASVPRSGPFSVVGHSNSNHLRGGVHCDHRSDELKSEKEHPDRRKDDGHDQCSRRQDLLKQMGYAGIHRTPPQHPPTSKILLRSPPPGRGRLSSSRNPSSGKRTRLGLRRRLWLRSLPNLPRDIESSDGFRTMACTDGFRTMDLAFSVTGFPSLGFGIFRHWRFVFLRRRCSGGAGYRPLDAILK